MEQNEVVGEAVESAEQAEETHGQELVEGQEQAEGDGTTEETQQEEVKAPNPEDEVLAPYKKEGKFDVESFQRDQQAKAWAHETYQMMSQSPELEAAYLETLQKQGRLPPQGQQRLRDLKTANVKPPDAPKLLSDDELNTKLSELRAGGREVEAQKLYHDQRIAPQFSETERKLKDADDTRRRENDMAIRQQQESRVRTQFGEMADAYPAIAVRDEQNQFGFRWVDKKVQARAVEIEQGIIQGRMHPKDILRLTLLDMGLAQPKQPVKETKPAPTGKKTAAPPLRAKNQEPGAWTIEVQSKTKK